MAVLLKKPGTRNAVPEPSVAVPSQLSEIAAAAALDKLLTTREKLAPLYAQIKELQEQVKPLEVDEETQEVALYHALAPKGLKADEKKEFKVGSAIVEIGKEGTKTVITDMPALAKKLGKHFIELATVKIGDLGKYLSQKEQEGIVEKQFTGKRNIKIHKASGEEA